MSHVRPEKNIAKRSRPPTPGLEPVERSTVPVAETRSDPTYDEIARRAYQCWHERGCPDGSPEIDWSRAEQELRSRGQTESEQQGGRRAQAAFPAI